MSFSTDMLLRAIARARKRDDVVPYYQHAIALAMERTDWATVNTAIKTKWSMAGLLYIKSQAWRPALGPLPIIRRP